MEIKVSIKGLKDILFTIRTMQLNVVSSFIVNNNNENTRINCINELTHLINLHSTLQACTDEVIQISLDYEIISDLYDLLQHKA